MVKQSWEKINAKKIYINLFIKFALVTADKYIKAT